MKPETVVALMAVGVALLTSIVVPLSTHLYSVRQQKRTWARQYRVELYADVLAEAVAERQFFKLAVHPAPHVTKLPSLTDTRRPQSERRALGAKVMIGASKAVGDAFAVHSTAAGAEMIAKVRSGEISATLAEKVIAQRFDALQLAMRKELGTDKVKP